MSIRSAVGFAERWNEAVKTWRANFEVGVLTFMGLVLGLSALLVYLMARDKVRGDVDQFVADKARILAQAVNPRRLESVRFDERAWRDDRFTPFAQTFDLKWNLRFLSSRLSEPVLPSEEVRRHARHPLGMLLHESVAADGQAYRMATVTIEREGETLGYAQVGVRHAERDAPLRQLRGWLLTGVVAALGVGAVGIRLTVRQWHMPLATLAETAKRLTASGGTRHRFVAPPESPELVEVAGAFNQLLDRLAVLLEAQQQLLGDASHELRTPLAVLRGELEVAMRRERTGAEYRATLETCRDEIERLSRLADNLLALARLDAGARLELDEKLDLGTLCREAAERIEPRAREHGASLQIDALAGLPVMGDRLGLERVLSNLLDNAVRHTPRGETVEIRAFQERCEAVVTVTDHGPGIAAEHHDRIFDRFYRVEKARPRDGGGTGLGLAIVRALLTAHGGSVEVRSQVGQGATFTMRLPLAGRAE
jgi:heavy metal sensor kinase